MEAAEDIGELRNCEIKPRDNPQRRKERVVVGCGAGFAGDRPLAARKLLERADHLDYLVLECLAERTLADRYQLMTSGGKGYDPRISDWMSALLPLAMERGVCIITNMGAVDPLGAQRRVLDVARDFGLEVTVAVAYEVSQGAVSSEGSSTMGGGLSTYLGAAPIAECLERYKPHVVITSRVADAALFLAPMVYELGWDWNDFERLAQGALAGHLLECGCQLTGGYFMHPEDGYRDISSEQLLDISLPFAEVSYLGEVYVGKTGGSGGLLSCSTCSQQLLYEVADPGCYITPDVVIDFREVYFCQMSNDRVLCAGAKPSNVQIPMKLLQLIPKDCGWKGWGEISYGGCGCRRRAEAAEFLVKSWLDEVYPGIKDNIVSYIIGYDSLKTVDMDVSTKHVMDTRLRMDGLFKLREHAVHFAEEFTALYTNGPAGGGGICTGHKKEIILQKELVARGNVFWRTEMRQLKTTIPRKIIPSCDRDQIHNLRKHRQVSTIQEGNSANGMTHSVPAAVAAAAPSGKILLYQAAHCRAGDKGNDLNFSIIPHFPRDIERLKVVVTSDWVRDVVSSLLTTTTCSDPRAIERKNDLLDQVRVEIYEARGIHSLNVVVRNILDGGVNCSRRIDRHGKTVSDLILCQEVVLPPPW